MATRSTPRISGRVYDEQGRPVPDAVVRLAVGGEAGGKAVTATTDRSGAFTLRGVRAGSSYTVVAKSEDDRGQARSGRAEVQAPQSNVRITLKGPSGDQGATGRTVRPARPSIAPASNVEESEQEDEADEVQPKSSSPRTSREDLDAPAPEAEAVKPGKKPRSSPRLSIPSDVESGPSDAGAGREGDDVNPLPPALDPRDRTSDAAGSVTNRQDESVELAGHLVAESRNEKQVVSSFAAEPDWNAGRAEPSTPDGPNPHPLPRELVADQGAPAQVSPAPVPARELLAQAPGVGPRRSTIRRAGPLPSIAAPPAEESEVVASLPPRPSRSASDAVTSSRPTWGEISLRKQAIPLDETLLRTAGTPRPTASAPSRPVTPVAAAARPAPKGVSCDFDPTENRLRDFCLPDLQGRMVSLRDFDADLILLDFWGTTCKPCFTAIPHLNDIQKVLGGKRVQVIGIACEGTPAKVRAAKVAEAAQRLKIGYPVLVTTMDGSCPVQEALDVHYMPTMILVDRQGRIIRREQGANEQSLARMDRFIYRSLGLPVPWNLDGPDKQLVGPASQPSR
ncbi:redoxin domain-containing protein [Aquisphaera insulae]|uniref:redoxin domain-containing protein n=1 Tax=Aquisphaera insulae TaxID=2712864 RepID=UPI0013EA1790|nr:redoxin domain-containing protein [Aquisphaera insulae]